MAVPLRDKIRTELIELRASWRTLILTLILGLIGGLFFAHFKLPLPWVLGPMSTTTIAALSGVRIWIPRWLQIPMTFILGLLFGTTIAPNLFSRVVEWLPSVIAVFLYVLATTAVSMAYMTKIVKADVVTSYFSSAPGGVIPMTIMGAHYGGEMRLIGLVQSMRLITTVIVIPISFALFAGYHPTGNAGTGVALDAIKGIDIPILMVMACGGWIGAKLLRLPAPELVGPLLVMGILHATQTYTAPIPDVLVALAQLTTGARLGAGFYRLNFRTFGIQLFHATAVALLMLAMGIVFSFAVGPFSPKPETALILAYAPGGIAEMSIIAFGLGIEVVFVITHQLIRFVFVVALVPIVVAVFKMKAKADGPD